MGKKLAIKGHPTRGKEVIELLVMMGGTNPFSNGMVIGNKATNCYYISEDTATKYISWDYIGPDEINEYKIFTLEEFLEKYPFKVGDKVIDDSGESGIIIEMKWDEEIIYKVDFGKECYYFASDFLRPYKEANINENKVESTGFMQMGKTISVIFNSANYENEVELQLGDYEIEIRDGKTYAVLKKPKYPTTYAECCEVLMGKTNFSEFSLAPIKYSNTTKFDNSVSYDAPHIELFNNLYKIFICRNAYWKIAGEQMGLDRPWEPDWNDHNQHKFGIHNVQNNIHTITLHVLKNLILVFPTEEMRDAFYENFDYLIEACKELL